MKSRTRIIMGIGLLLLAGVLVLWLSNRQSVPAEHNANVGAKVAATQSSATTAAGAKPSAPIAKAPTLNTNKLAYRLSNTTSTLRQLQPKAHSILLENALIDTEKPLKLNIPENLRSSGYPGAYIVQARGIIDARFRSALTAVGAQYVAYIPNNAYLVNLTADQAGMLSGNPLVQAVLPYEPYYKVQSTLLGLAVNQQNLPPGTALTLGLFAADAAKAEAQVTQLGAQIIGRDQSPFGPVLRVLPPPDWTSLAQSPVVQFVEPAHARRMANDLSRVVLGVSADTLTPTNYMNLYGSNVIVAVNDSGVDTNHPDFTTGGTPANGPGPVSSTSPIRVTGFTMLDMVDTNGHGTHVAGIIAGNGAASWGTGLNENPQVNVGQYAEGSIQNADYRGKAPLANLFSMNLFNYSDYQLQTNAATVGALISNNSWDYGNDDAEYDLAAASYDFATRDALPYRTGSQPVLFVFAAGNDGGGADDGTGGTADTILSPGTAKNVITVGALEQLRDITNIVTFITGTGTNTVSNNVAYWQPQTDSSGQVAYYSSRGNVGVGTEGSYGRFKPDVVSPGSFVVSTSSQFNDEWDTNAYYNPTNILGTTYPDQVVTTNALAYYNVQVPPNAVGVMITVYPNSLSPSPFPTNIPIYAKQSAYPTTVSGGYDLLTTNVMDIPPAIGDAAMSGISAIQGSGFDFGIGDPLNSTFNYDMTVDILMTNDLGNLYSVLEGMNDSLGGYYRYESGTSMAAASISGLLALIQDYFTNQFQPPIIPSPALMKAYVINGSRSVGDYGLAFTNSINFQGWGMDNIQNSLPTGGIFNQTTASVEGSSFFVDQSPTNALATGDSHTFIVNLDQTGFAQFYQMQATLVWTDPPGDPAAAIKLVNNLELVVTNMDTNDFNYGSVYYGNDISPNIGYNQPWNTNGPPNIDTINNVQSVILPPLLGAVYSVTVIGHSVNVNAVTAQTNNVLGQFEPNIVQDYALVVSVGEGEVPNAFSVADNGIVSNPTGDQDITQVITTNAPLMNQLVGASSPLMGTNQLALGNNTVWGPNGVLTIGQTNQWHFYVVTNNGQSDYTNAAFLTFQVNTLSIPRTGVYADTVANATKPEADIDLFVSQDPTLMNLNPVVISNCLAGANNSRASVYNAGTQFVFYTNSAPGQIYYIGVQAQDQMASEYSFLPVFTDVPFSSLDQNGNEIVNGLMLPMPVLQGNNAHPGVTNVFALAIMPMEVEKVIVTNWVQHQNFGDLVGTLSFGGQYAILNNHDGYGNTFGPPSPYTNAYDDSPNHPLGTTKTDGPGSLLNFRGKSAQGPWILNELDDSAGGFSGQIASFTLLIQPHRNLLEPGIVVAVPPGGWFVDWVDVSAGYTNLTFYATNVTSSPGTPAIQMYEKLGNDPTLTDYDQEATLTNGVPPGNSISIGPPLAMGQYFVGIYNPSPVSQNVFLSATLGVNLSVSDIFNYSSGSQPLLDDAVTGSTITVPNMVTQLVASVNVGLVIDSPRISDYAFTLVSPTGQRVLLMENRGGTDTNGAGMAFVYTNVLNATANGGAAPNTNYLAVNPQGSVVPIIWNFFSVPDQMTVYDTTNPADFDTNSIYLLYNTGMTNNPPSGSGGGSQNTVPFTYDLVVPPGISNITIIMNQFGNPYASGGDAWTYTAGAPVTNYEYLEFTDNTNLTDLPIKFAATPFNFFEVSSNYTLSDLDYAVPFNYFGQTNIYDPFGGWIVPTNTVVISTFETNGIFGLMTNTVLSTNNLVSVYSDPSVALGGDSGGSNYLALGSGTIMRSIPTVPGRIYNVTFWYRGPGIAAWWRGEGNGLDSSDPEYNNNNGKLIGRFNFPAGEVGQAFGFEDNGNTYQFAGTNTYVQVPASPSLNVGAGGGFTLEGWINPTNLTRPQPLVEWLANATNNMATATNALLVDTNMSILQGPVLDPATGHYYYLLASTNWGVSDKWAQELGGHLVTLDSANEDEWVYDTFTAYGTLNRDLWTGFSYHPTPPPGAFEWVSGSTNVAYTNWVPGEPFTACNNAQFAAIMGPTNAYPGLWQLLSYNGEYCTQPPTNPIYGVAEVPQISTNGVQFWICGTNWTGATNTLQGCLAANIVDTNYVSHWIYSQPGLLTNNVYQHVALTFNTNSGVAALYLNGTNVASSNLFAGGISFVPKTDGDLLLGWDMSLYTNNYYGGAMDEMSVYGRTLTLAEITAIYQASASTSNRLVGKFDPTVTPATGLAEALVTFGTSSNIIYGVNDIWEVNSFTFTATTNTMPLTISGIEPGILLDSFAVEEAPLTNLYYFPEQPLASLIGDEAAGNWTLQVWDSRTGAYVTNADQLVNWQLSFVLQSNAMIAAELPPETPVLTTVPSGQTTYYSVTVPAWAHEATNILVSSTEPVNMFYFDPTNSPNLSYGPDFTMLTQQTGGVGAPVLVTNAVFPFTLFPNQTYYLGVQNNGPQSANVVLQVNYDILGLTNTVPFTATLTDEYQSVRYFSFDVDTNAYEATFQLLKLQSNADLVVSKGIPLPTLTNDTFGSFNVSNADQNIYVLTNTTPVPLSGGRWYLGVFNRGITSPLFSVLAKDLVPTNGVITNGIMPAIIKLTNGVPFTWTAGPGADLTNFFYFLATNAVVNGTNIIPLYGLRFELFNSSGVADLTVQTNMLPLSPPFLQTSQNGNKDPNLIFIYTNNVMTNLAANWFLGVPNHEITNITYSIVAEVITNPYFPAFPGAEGAGGGARGGRFGDVYHVISTADSGYGTLRDAVTSATTNRTVVFDISGNILLTNALVITNSYLTVAGETAPGGGVTVSGGTLTIQSNHDVVVRDVRFRTESILAFDTNNFEGAIAGDYTSGQIVAGWTVNTNQTSVVADPTDAYGGHKNFLALANGTISNNFYTVAGRSYSIALTYRGPGIASWWRGENNNYMDSIGGNNGTPENGGPTFTPGEVGNAFSFNGINNILLVPNTSVNVGAGSGMTAEGWILPTTTVHCLIYEYERTLGSGSGSDVGVQFAVNRNIGVMDVPGALSVNIVDTLGITHLLGTSSSVVSSGSWNHVAMKYDNASGFGALYVNGVVVAQKNMGVFTPQTTFANLLLGARTYLGSISSPNEQFQGNMDELSCYNRSLSTSELKAFYQNGKSGKYDPAVFASSPSQSIAEAMFSISGITNNTVLGNNTSWQTKTISFTATGPNTSVFVQGIEPGMLLDSVTLLGESDMAGSLQLNSVSNAIVDHVSTSWSTNNDLSILASTNVTVQWSIIADPLANTNFYYSAIDADDIAEDESTNMPGTGVFASGGGGSLSFHHNLFTDVTGGCLHFGDDLTVDFVNNVAYNWLLWPVWTGGLNDLVQYPTGCTNQLNLVCNYFIAGPDTAVPDVDGEVNTNIAYFGGDTNALAANWIFQTNNFIDVDTNGVLNGANLGWEVISNDFTPFNRAFAIPPVSVDEAYQAYEKVLDFAGVNMALRDPADTNIVNNVRMQTGRLVTTVPIMPELNSSLPYLDTDQDGLPDFWESTFTPALLYIPSNNNDRDGDGYTDLEEYNNWLAGLHALTVTNTPVDVDLYQLFGGSGHLAFFVTNSVHGFVYLTNVLGVVTNTSTVWSNTVAVFTPTNILGGTNYYGYASFDCFVTNRDTAAYFGPVTLSVIVSAVPIRYNTNFPPVITPLISGVSSDPTNYGGSDFYSIQVTTNDYGALFEIDNPTGPMALVVKKGANPSLSVYDYYTNLPAAPANQEVAVLTNSAPVPLSPGTWYMAAVNESGSNVIYTAKITLLQNIYAPEFLYPSNLEFFTNIETTLLTITCQALDTNTPPLPLTYKLLSGPAGMALTNGVIYWTSTQAQAPSTNPVAVSVSNGAFAVTNNFTVIVEVSNMPPVLPLIPNQLVIIPDALWVPNTAADPNILSTILGYTLSTTVTGSNQPFIDSNGNITWTPLAGQEGTNYLFTTVVENTNQWAVNAKSLSATNSFYVTVLPPFSSGVPVTNIFAPNSIEWFAVAVPTNAIFATNRLLFSSLPVNLWYSTNLPPTTNNAADRLLFYDATSGVTVLSTNLANAPTNLVPGGVYFLGVQNLNAAPVTGALEVDFGYPPPPGLFLPSIPFQVIFAGETLIVTNTATDTNSAATLAYNLTTAPTEASASISTNGIITWPTATNMPVTFTRFTTVVNDSTDHLSATNSFFVLVLPELNPNQPTTNIIAPNSTNWFVVNVPTNVDMATNILLFATAPVNLWYSTNKPPSVGGAGDSELLTNSVAGLHVITTTSTPRLVPGSQYYLGVQNNNNFAVTNAVNVEFHYTTSPTFTILSITPTNNTITNGYLITWFAPTNDQFHLEWTATLSSQRWSNFNGVISYKSVASPTNAQFQYFDDGSQTGGFGPTRFYRLLLLQSPTNTPPYFLYSPTVFYVNPSVPFAYTNAAQDWDVPAQSLAYFVTNSLLATNLSINPLTGVITWTPSLSLAGQTNLVGTTVTDSGVPPQSARNLFYIVVTTNSLAPMFSKISVVTNGVQFLWSAPTNDQFQIRWTTNLAPAYWQLFPGTITSPTGNFMFVDTNTMLLMKFYQLILLP